MDTLKSSSIFSPSFVDIQALRHCGIFPVGKEPSIRTLRQWTRLRRIPHHRVGHFVYYDVAEVGVSEGTYVCAPLPPECNRR